MNSKFLFGNTMHHRLGSTEHYFKYPVYMCLFDLGELSELSNNNFFFKYNKKGVLSLYDMDYLDPVELTLKEKVINRLSRANIYDKVERIELLTTPRYFGYVFNPASFFYCYDKSNLLIAVILEVNNTFGEKHSYVFPGSNSNKIQSHIDKNFYVSPFYDIEGKYLLETIVPNGKIDIKLNLIKEENCEFRTRVWGKTENFNGKVFAKNLIRSPLTAILTMPRIIFQAAKLYYGKKMKVQAKPFPTEDETFVSNQPNIFTKIYINSFDKLLGSLKNGGIKVKMPNGEIKNYGTQESRTPLLKVHSYSFFKNLALKGDIAFGESYSEGEIDTNDLTGVLEFFARNIEIINSDQTSLSLANKLITAIQHFFKKNSLRGSKKNISDHYDLSNNLFESFLDSTMTYSSGFYNSPEETLKEAQLNKIDKIIDKAKLKKDDHILEIGSGWGSFAIRAAQRIGCKVTGLTLSIEQLEFAEKRVKELNLDHLIDFKLEDYRKIQGKFDKIVSIEMLEAVGYQYYNQYFSSIDRLLNKNGIAVIQTITIPDYRYEQAKYGIDWIQKHIFPGSTIPSITALSQAMSKSSKLYIESLENIGPHYAKTLATWRENFNKNSSRIKELGFDDHFYRAWNYYLSYCEAGFRSRVISVIHMVLTRENNMLL